MKNLFLKMFEISNEKKIPTHVFINRIMLSASIIMMCMLMLTVSAYAYFSVSFRSHNTITSAFYSLSIENKQGIVETNGSYILENNTGADMQYHFLLDKDESSATVGYAKIVLKNTINNNTSYYYVEPIGTFLESDNEITVNKRAIQITIPAGGVYKVDIIPEWGTCAVNGEGSELSYINEISLSQYNAISQAANSISLDDEMDNRDENKPTEDIKDDKIEENLDDIQETNTDENSQKSGSNENLEGTQDENTGENQVNN